MLPLCSAPLRSSPPSSLPAPHLTDIDRSPSHFHVHRRQTPWLATPSPSFTDCGDVSFLFLSCCLLLFPRQQNCRDHSQHCLLLCVMPRVRRSAVKRKVNHELQDDDEVEDPRQEQNEEASQQPTEKRDVEKMVSLKGMIIRCSSLIPEIREAVFRCLVCGYYSDPSLVDRGRINEPTICGRQECLSKNSMTLVHNRCRHILIVFI